MCRLSWNLGASTSWNPQGLSRYVMGLLYIYTYLFTPWSRVLLEKLTGFQLVKKFPALYGTRRFITAFTSARRLSLSWARSIQSIPPYPISWTSISIISSHLRLGLPSGLFPSGYPTKTLCTPLLSPIRATCPAHLILLDFITWRILGEQYRSLSSSLRSFLHYSVTSSLLSPNILLNTLFSNTLSLRTSPSVSDQVPHPYKRTGKIIVLFTLIFKFLNSKVEDNKMPCGQNVRNSKAEAGGVHYTWIAIVHPIGNFDVSDDEHYWNLNETWLAFITEKLYVG